MSDYADTCHFACGLGACEERRQRRNRFVRIELCNRSCNHYNDDMRQKLYTLAAAANKIGCHKSTTMRKAEELALGQRVGRYVLLTEAEVKRLAKAIKPRPRD